MEDLEDTVPVPMQDDETQPSAMEAWLCLRLLPLMVVSALLLSVLRALHGRMGKMMR